MIKFEALVSAAYSSEEALRAAKKSNPEVGTLYTLAWELDSLRQNIADGAAQMAGRFAAYANALESDRMSIAEPPTGWSTLREMDRNATAYDVNLKMFETLFERVTTRKLVEVKREVEAARAKEAMVKVSAVASALTSTPDSA